MVISQPIEVEGNLLQNVTCNSVTQMLHVTTLHRCYRARVFQEVKNMLLRVKYETKLKLEPPAKLFIIVVHNIVVILLLSNILKYVTILCYTMNNHMLLMCK